MQVIIIIVLIMFVLIVQCSTRDRVH